MQICHAYHVHWLLSSWDYCLISLLLNIVYNSLKLFMSTPQCYVLRLWFMVNKCTWLTALCNMYCIYESYKSFLMCYSLFLTIAVHPRNVIINPTSLRDVNNKIELVWDHLYTIVICKVYILFKHLKFVSLNINQVNFKNCPIRLWLMLSTSTCP